jgi:2-polyprenyl-3-methyl-5-hydroxy-6-metoxy-1,4-benzoquinol methylase
MRPEAEPSTPKDRGYFAGANEHLVALLPPEARRVLDVGCAAGALGEAIKESRPGILVDGLDRESAVLEEAAARLDRVRLVDLDGPLPESSETYDTIICGDVLEHLIDPWRVLRWLTAQLEDGGHVVASIPNLRYYKVLRDLVLRGRFTYRDSGILDATHLRFFTLHEMESLFTKAGLEVIERKPRIGGGNAIMRGLDWICFGRLEPFRTKQYTLLGRKTSSA